MEKNKIGREIYLLIAVFILLFLLSLFFISRRPFETKEIDVYFRVEENRAGFDLNNSYLTFGIIPPGGQGVRNIDLKNNYDSSVLVKFSVTKDIASYIEIPRELVLEEGEEKKVEIIIHVPSNAEEKNYTGVLYARFFKIRD